MDAESALIKSILERLGCAYSVHDTTEPKTEAAFRKRCGESAALPMLCVGKRIQWSATQLPPLEQSGELQRALAKARDAKLGRDEYKWGVAYLHRSGGVRRDAYAAYEWFRRSARRGDAKGQSALGTLLASGEAGVVDESEALRWYEASAAGGCHSALLAIDRRGVGVRCGVATRAR